MTGCSRLPACNCSVPESQRQQLCTWSTRLLDQDLLVTALLVLASSASGHYMCVAAMGASLLRGQAGSPPEP